MRYKKLQQKIIAKQRIKELFKQADTTEDLKKANRYIYLARKIAMKLNIKIPSQLKRKFCKHCYSYFKFGVNARKRIRNKKIIYYCLNCKKYTRIPYKK